MSPIWISNLSTSQFQKVYMSLSEFCPAACRSLLFQILHVAVSAPCHPNRASIITCRNKAGRNSGLIPWPRGLPNKEDWEVYWKFWKEPLVGTRILFCGHGLKLFSPLGGSSSKTAHYLLLYVLSLIPKAPAVHRMRFKVYMTDFFYLLD